MPLASRKRCGGKQQIWQVPLFSDHPSLACNNESWQPLTSALTEAADEAEQATSWYTVAGSNCQSDHTSLHVNLCCASMGQSLGLETARESACVAFMFLQKTF
jgi:hypothetical protein